MYLLFVHADSFAFERTAATDLEREDGQPVEWDTEGALSECVVVCATVEAGDTSPIVGAASAAIESVTDQLHTSRLVVYPTTHLTENRASTEVALQRLGEIGSRLNANHEVMFVPPGWGTRVELARKGHPHAVQSRQISAEAHAANARASTWRVLSPDGHTRPLAETDTTVRPSMRRIVESEGGDGDRIKEDESSESGDSGAHVKALSDAGLAQFDSGAEKMLLTPRGTVLRDVLQSHVHARMREYEFPNDDPTAIPVDAPNAWSHRLAATDEKRPVSLVGTVEQSRQTDASTAASSQGVVVTMRSLTAHPDNTQAHLGRQVGLLSELLSTLDIEFDPLVRVTDDWLHAQENTRQPAASWLGKLSDTFDREALVEVVTEPSQEWDMRVEFVTPSEATDAGEPPTVQIERDQSETGGAETTHSESLERAPDQARPAVVSCSVPIGGLVRALGERAARGDRPHLPTWLAPTQVRCIPIESRHLDSCERLAEQLAAEAVRVDIDDRERPVGERIEAADRAWVPYTVVVGDDEGDSERLGVFDRNAGRERHLTVAELATRVRDETEMETQQRQSLPRRLSAYSVLV